MSIFTVVAKGKSEKYIHFRCPICSCLGEEPKETLHITPNNAENKCTIRCLNGMNTFNLIINESTQVLKRGRPKKSESHKKEVKRLARKRWKINNPERYKEVIEESKIRNRLLKQMAEKQSNDKC
jgi:hypothetical protein